MATRPNKLRRSLSLLILPPLIFAAWAAKGGLAAPPGGEPARGWAERVLAATGVQGGLIVQLGCADAERTAALRRSERYLVQALDTDPDKVARARRLLQSHRVYGPVSAEMFDGQRLPYVDNLANLVLAEDLGRVSMDEVMRVLCPGGVAYIRHGGAWTKTVKRRPAKIDEWSHYLYDPSNNAVSHDMAVGPPAHFQWTGGPRWARNHDRRASLSAMVSAGGRIFYIFDEGPTASVMLPSKTVLAARDAFNGVILWKREIPKWFPRLWPFKSGPAQLQRRLVAVGDRIYATLGLDAPLVALDAATGETLRTYKGTFATEEVLVSNGVLFALVNESPQNYDDFRPQDINLGRERDEVMVKWPWNEQPRRILAIQADTGELLWKADARVVPLTLAVDQNRVYYHDGKSVAARDRKTGALAWTSAPVQRREIIPANITPTLVAYGDVILFTGASSNAPKLTGLSAETGKILWSEPQLHSGHYCAEDVLVAGGLVWGGAIAAGKDSGLFIGRDPHTGEVKSRFSPDTDIYFMHQRCYRSKATERFLIPSRTGSEFIDFRREHWITNHWVRGGCIYGLMPCNGLLYTPPHDCACYMQAKLYGFCALAAEEPSKVGGDSPAGSDEDRLQRGPAYEALRGESATAARQDDWPVFRHDAARSGFTRSPVPPQLQTAWRSPVGGRLSAPVIAGGRVFVTSIDSHAVLALDAVSGAALWSYTAGGRVDSPPAVSGSRVLFGSADGCVYCLRASDGALAWRFRAAPEERRMTAFDQVESVWPVHGSVLVQDGVVYCVAGRSMFLDGGLHYLRLNERTGRKLGERIFDDRDPETGENLQSHVMVRNMPVALPDVLSSDGRFLYMRSQRLDREGRRFDIAPHSGKDAEQGAVQKGEGVHLFSPTGFLDGSWWHRSYWVYGRSFAEGAGGWPQAEKYAPAGRILTVDDSRVYGFGRKPFYYRWRTPMEYHLFATSKDPEIVRPPARRGAQKQSAGPRLPHPEYVWSRAAPLLVRAMAGAGSTLFIAGPPDVVDEEEAFHRLGDPAIQAKLAEQEAAWGGAEGALLWAVSTEDGRKLAELPLKNLPTFDGMAAARGALYLTTVGGDLLCLRGE